MVDSQWEKQSLEKKQEIEATSVKAVSMEEKVKEAEREYIKLEEKNKNTTRAISTTKKEIEELQTKVVSNGDGISHEHNQEAATVSTFHCFCFIFRLLYMND